MLKYTSLTLLIFCFAPRLAWQPALKKKSKTGPINQHWFVVNGRKRY